MESVLGFLQASPVFALFVIIALGFVLGKIRIGGFSLDVSAVIFVSLFFGHHGVLVPSSLQSMGLVLFIFTVGIQAGPGFFRSFRQRGRHYVVLSLLLVLVSLLVALGFRYALGLDSDILAGLLCGALTSTPGLSVAIESTNSPLASIGYGVAYPLGVVGVILFVKLLPRILRVDPAVEYSRLAASRQVEQAEVRHQTFRVAHSAVFGKRLSEISFRAMTDATVSRVQRGQEMVTPSPETVLHEGDLIRAVGTDQALARVSLLVGPAVEEELSLHRDYRVSSLLVTNKSIVNHPLSHIQMEYGCQVVVTRIRRSGIDFSPSPSTTLRYGDKVTVACHKGEMDRVSKLLGNNARALSDTDFFPIALGIVLGVLLGKVEVSLGSSFSMNLGLTGGVLIAALVLSSVGKTGPILWTMTGAANHLLRQLGLLLFLAGVGSSAGQDLVRTLSETGPQLLLVGFALTLVPMLVTLVLNRLIFKTNLFELFGIITGGMTSTPGLAACESMSHDETPSVVYATVYPVAMVALLLAVKVLAML